MAAGADECKSPIDVDGAEKKPVGFDVQFSIAPETAGEMMVPVSPEPVVLPFGDGADRGFERVHIVVFAFETLDVAQEGGLVDDLAHHR